MLSFKAMTSTLESLVRSFAIIYLCVMNGKNKMKTEGETMIDVCKAKRKKTKYRVKNNRNGIQYKSNHTHVNIYI